MAADLHYPPSLIPWQVLPDDSPFSKQWTVDLVGPPPGFALCMLHVTWRPLSGYWSWAIYPYDTAYRDMGSPEGWHLSYEACELSMLTCLAAWLHRPSSRNLPSQEGATGHRKGRGCA